MPMMFMTRVRDAKALRPIPQPRHGPQRTDCVAGHVRFELRSVVANYPFERSDRFPGIRPNFGRRDHSRLSCSAGIVGHRRGRHWHCRKPLVAAAERGGNYEMAIGLVRLKCWLQPARRNLLRLLPQRRRTAPSATRELLGSIKL